ncbi:MAG: hypothetical protein AB7G76_00145 [Steroidobacteraceae bacterium]
MRLVKAGLAYFAIVFAIGTALGIARVMLLVPRLGVRPAELLELPLILIASFIVARACVRRFGPFTSSEAVGIGTLALALLIVAELGITMLSGQGVREYIAGRDPVAGSAYLLSLALFALMPLLCRRGP